MGRHAYTGGWKKGKEGGEKDRIQSGREAQI